MPLKKKVLLARIVALCCFTSLTAFASQSSAIEFNEVTVNSPYKLTQEIIAADVLPATGKELVTFSIDEQSNRWLMIYQLDTSTNKYEIAELSIIPKQFYRFDITESKENKLQKIYTLYLKLYLSYCLHKI